MVDTRINMPLGMKLRWQPETLGRASDRSFRYELFEDWVTTFVARTGGWPGGPHYAGQAELTKEMTEPGWDWHLRRLASPLAPEIEFDVRVRLVPASRVILALRVKLRDLNNYIDGGALPKPYLDENNNIVWKFDEIADLLLLAERIKNVYFESNLVADTPFERAQIYLSRADVNSREYKEQFIGANLQNLSNWQLDRMVEVVKSGPDAQLRTLPENAPRLWSERTEQEKKRGRGFISPSEFILAVWGPWLKQGLLGEDDLEQKDPELLAAYRHWLYRHKGDRLDLLKQGQSELEKRVYGITHDTAWEEVERIALAVAKSRQRRMNRPRLS